jgi:hypothetical protein
MINLRCVASPGSSPNSLSGAAAAIALGAALALAPTWALAEIQVRGTPKAVSVQAENASIEELLVALTNTFDVQFRSSANLEKRLTGTYEGTLQQVLSRILGGYDFVVKFREKGLEITLLGAGNTITLVGASHAFQPVQQRTEAAAEQPFTADHAVRPAPVASSGGPTPTIKVAEGPPRVPVAVPPGSASAPVPVPERGSGPAPLPTPPAPGATPSLAPPMPGASAAIPPSANGATPSVPSPLGPANSVSSTSAAPSPSAAPPAPSPAH